MKAWIEPWDEVPGEAGARAAESVGVWRLAYGPVTGGLCHTGAIFGFIPVGVCRAWAWAVVPPAPLAVLRAGREAFRTFMAAEPWTLWAEALPGPATRFLRFLDFLPAGPYFVRQQWA